MELLAKARRALNVDDDALAAHRDRIRLNFSRLGAIALTPFTVLHLVGANWRMFAVNAILVGVMLANVWTLHRGRAPFIPFWALSVLMVAGACASVLQQGLNGVLWAYPAVFMFFFVLPRGTAMALGLVMLLAVPAASTVSLGWPLASRIFMSLGCVLIMINVVLNVIGELQRALVVQAITDPLTGAYNRRHLQEQLAQRVAPIAKAATGDALLAIDIDHFKRINDSYGHAFGDQVLRAVAQVLKAMTPVGDQVLCRMVNAIGARKRAGDLLFRTGGEEFVLLLPRVTLPAAQRVAEELRQRLAQADLIPGEAVTVSIGISTLAPGQSVDAWMHAADTALYEAKNRGRNRIAVATTA